MAFRSFLLLSVSLALACFGVLQERRRLRGRPHVWHRQLQRARLAGDLAAGLQLLLPKCVASWRVDGVAVKHSELEVLWFCDTLKKSANIIS